MVQINFAHKEIQCKVVYYGPGMSGKTTNLELVHEKTPKDSRGELTSIATTGERTLYFDYMPLDLGSIAGIRTKFQLYTVPGQIYYKSTRRLVLQGVDGIVFVADSSAGKTEENRESMRDLEENLKEMGRSMKDLPIVVQYNKRDLPDALPIDDLQKQVNVHGLPHFEAVATTGQGVFPTLKALASMVLEAVNKGGLAAARAPRASQAGSSFGSQAGSPRPASAAATGGTAPVPAPAAAPRAMTSPGTMPLSRPAASAGGFLEPSPVRVGPGAPPPPRMTPPPVPAPRPTAGTGIGGVLPSRPPSGAFASPLPAPAAVPPAAPTPVPGRGGTPTGGRTPLPGSPNGSVAPSKGSTPPPGSASAAAGRTGWQGPPPGGAPGRSSRDVPAREAPKAPRSASAPIVTRSVDERIVRVSGLGRPSSGGGRVFAFIGLLGLVAAAVWWMLTHLKS